jgi:chemotaxis protein CheX
MIDMKTQESLVFPAPIADAVRQATRSTFGSICGADPVPLANGQKPQPCSSVVGVISYAGTLAWSFALVLPEKTATALAEKFAGFPISFESPDMGDVVGEMANVIAGDISARLDAKGIFAQMSLPTVARGHDVELFLPPGLPTLYQGYVTPQGPFWFRLVTAKPGSGIAHRLRGS